MKHFQSEFAVMFIGVLVLLYGCAAMQPPVTVQPQTGEGTLLVKASNFKFEPNNIKVRRGDTVVFVIENISDTKHNFSVKNPSGRVFVNVDVPARSKAQTKIAFEGPGIYEFYCDEPFHSTLGMKGRIEVA